MLQTYAESIEQLTSTRRTVDEQPISMGDMRKELETLREERVNYADDIKKYTQKMDEMDREVCLGYLFEVTFYKTTVRLNRIALLQ